MGGRGSGGARANSGPEPDVNALKRNRDGQEWTTLPAAGRLDPAPEWPDDVPAPSPEELIRWRTLWALPQAKIWEADHIYDQVALYVRVYIEAMQQGGASTTRVLAKQLQNELLLSPQSLASAKYVVAGTNEADAINQAMATSGNNVTTLPSNGQPGSAKRRFNVVGQPGPDPSAVAPAEDEDDEPDEDEEIPF